MNKNKERNNMTTTRKLSNGNPKKLDRKELLTPFDKFVDNMFQELNPNFGKNFGVEFFQNGAYPRVDVRNYADRVEIEADIPGLTKDDIKIKVEDDVLSIEGMKQTQTVDNDEQKEEFVYIKKELKRSSFKRSFALEDVLNQDEIEAKFENGTLLITIPKYEHEKSPNNREIEIK